MADSATSNASPSRGLIIPGAHEHSPPPHRNCAGGTSGAVLIFSAPLATVAGLPEQVRKSQGMSRRASLAFALLLSLALGNSATAKDILGVTPYLPLNLDPDVENAIERVMILGDVPVMSRRSGRRGFSTPCPRHVRWTGRCASGSVTISTATCTARVWSS